MKNKLITILAVLMLISASCSTPKLPEPTVKYPHPPAELMKPAPKLETIKT